jgi:2-polyprenyl-3-methyl-5-hydroxy-6-metoxy-1,4-benzoquinol methylase
MEDKHSANILDQFTRQAAPFAAAAPVRNEAALARIVEAAHTSSKDTVLDVACGPGILACAFARKARHVTGIDFTPKMLEQARLQQATQGLSNLTWLQGDATKLPFEDASFSIVTSRFAFHHFVEPLVVLKEMIRVCKPGGMVVVTDSSPAAAKADAFNHMERLRDPSHTRSLPPEELAGLFVTAGLGHPVVESMPLPYELDSFLARSFPAEGGEHEIRKLFAASLSDDQLGLSPVSRDGRVLFTFPVAIVAARTLQR